jgi:peptidoglycan-associated lipoprotein
MRAMQLGLVLAMAALLAGCPKKIETKPDAGASAQTTNTGPSTTAVQPGANVSGSDMAAEQAAIQELQRLGMVIYFDYDKAEIKSEYVGVIAAHAKFLNGNVNRKIRLEGHTDERGSREYNIGLGERRAQQVRRALMLQGVTEAQITTVSYGEERPAASGSDEEAYAKNRRVEMSYSK